jgi:hypothetical protein
MARTFDKVRSVLEEADKKLLRLIAEFASDNDLSGVDTARTVALQIRAILDASKLGAKEMRKSHKGSGKDIATSKRALPESVDTKRTTYPKFEVRNSTLYRIGWSKKKKETYSHKVPRATVFDVVDVMTALVPTAPGPFTAEQIISRVNDYSSVSIPSYQAYTVIGFLRARSLIEQVGRDGYRIPEGLTSKVQELWKSLESNHG